MQSGEDRHICAHVCTTYLFIDISSCCVARARLKHVILLFKPPMQIHVTVSSTG